MQLPLSPPGKDHAAAGGGEGAGDSLPESGPGAGNPDGALGQGVPAWGGQTETVLLPVLRGELLQYRSADRFRLP